MNEQDSYYSMLAVTVVDIEKTPLDLPMATLNTSGGYRIKANNDILPFYSPIDMAICGLTALYNKERSVTSLNDWFINNNNPIGELWVTCTALELCNTNISIHSHSVIEWKSICRINNKLHTLFKMNAPFTFRNLENLGF